MTYTTILKKFPQAITLSPTNKSISLLIKGQGVFIFNNNDKPCRFFVYNQSTNDGYKVELTQNKVNVSRMSDGAIYEDSKNDSGLVQNAGAYYWFSLDAQNQTLRVGVGEARVETIIYSYTFLFTSNDDRKSNKLFMESLQTIHLPDASVQPLKLLRDPVTRKISPLVKMINELTMDDVASGKYLPKANLSLEAQQLYDCIAGTNFKLDTDDFPEFTQAIEYSIKTPGLWCYKRLQEKSTEFNKTKPNLLETYLRITLGENSGESPGIPYVMEIWPVGHYSPIHNHSGANAVIRVLNGEINVSQYPYLSTGETDAGSVKPFAVANFSKDQITWISQTLNQTHKLENLPKNAYTCITIQCYLYENKDNAHYDYFDYIDGSGKKQQYEPDSDMDFVAFKQLMKQEWANRSKTWTLKNLFCLP